MKYSKRRVHKRATKRTNKRASRTRKGRGGFFNTKVAALEHCNSENLISQMDRLKNPDINDEDINDVKNSIENTYKDCCPKKFGFKNRSPFCKQAQLNYDAVIQAAKTHQTHKYDALSPEEIVNLEHQYEGLSQKDINKMQKYGGKKLKTRRRKH